MEQRNNFCNPHFCQPRRMAKKQVHKEKEKMNRQGEGGIEWCDFTWSPVTGCEHNCSYCYARKIAMRFTGHFKPTFHPDRLRQPEKLKKPSKIFVCSMADLFGDWVCGGWINAVLSVTDICPQHTFMFLTKNPKRYQGFEFKDNCMIGATMDTANKERYEELLKAEGRKFVSCEPLLADMAGIDFSTMELVIVGAEKTLPPKKEWIDNIKHDNIFYKKNIEPYRKQ